jgi:hypothetical protein
MKTSTIHLIASLTTLGPAMTLFAQQAPSATAKMSWAENIGWMNWRDAGSPTASNGGSQGVKLSTSGQFLSGFIWAENTGYINVGDGTPANGLAYSNPTSGSIAGLPDFGVNINPATGELSGFAWGENIGWINFSMTSLAPAQRARMTSEDRLVGYAWGENVGWISFNASEQGQFVAWGKVCNDVDFNNDGSIFDPMDIDAFMSVFSEGPCIPAQATCDSVDFNNDGSIFDPQDIDAFMSVFSEGPCL